MLITDNDIGRTAIARDGREVTIVSRDGVKDYPFCDDRGLTYNQHGQFACDLREVDQDLIRWADEGEDEVVTITRRTSYICKGSGREAIGDTPAEALANWERATP